MEKRDFIYGRNPILEMLERGEKFDQILVQKGIDPAFVNEVKDMAGPLRIPVNMAPREKLARITRKNHQGVIGFTAWVTYANLERIIEESFGAGEIPLVLILDQVTDVRNVGAIARSAEVFGVDALVIPEKGAARIGADAVKTSAGAITRLAVCRERSLPETCKFLSSMGLIVLSADHHADDHISGHDLNVPLAIVMGSEGRGVSRQVSESVNGKFSIPQQGSIDSLNVSVAAGIALYEVMRQRQTSV